MRFIQLFLAACFLLLSSCEKKNYTGNSQSSSPVFQVDFPFPTADKPQSKLWCSENCWWALIPRTSGPSLWQRTETGWKEHTEITKSLKGIPGRADVWAEKDEVTAVGVGEDSLVVFRLQKQKNGSPVQWKARFLHALHPPQKTDKTETATIARDNAGRWWVAADAGKKVCAWTAGHPGENWEGPFILAEEIGKDDICAVAAIPEGVAVVWSDQLREAVKVRIHRNGQLPENWGDTEIIEAGNKTADDHLNTALSADGTLWLTTKNSVDSIGRPQFVVRVRSPLGNWVNYPYYNLDSVKHPSRPAIFSVEGNPALILSGHTVYNHTNRYLGKIEFGMIDTANPEILKQVTTVITPDTARWAGTNFINDITGPKAPFPKNAPWIVLASDKDGSVYEADLSTYFSKNKN